MKTVREIKNFVLRESSVDDHHRFCRLSDGHRAFYERLNVLGRRGIPLDPCVALPTDIDAAAGVTEYELKELLTEYRMLERLVRKDEVRPVN